MDKPQRPQPQVTIRLDESRLQAVEALADREQRSRSNMIAMLVAEALGHRGIHQGVGEEPARAQ